MSHDQRTEEARPAGDERARVTTEPGMTRPGTARSETTQSGATQSGATHPGTTHPGTTHPGASPRRAGYAWASFLLGFGMGGFLDGIFLHQVLQWHHMISNVLPPDSLDRLRTNVFADGLFNLAMWVATAAGIGLLWRSSQRGETSMPSTRVFAGWLLVGWGGFNLFDTVAFHAVLGLHHIRQVPDFLVYDIVFCTAGIALVAVGMALAREPKDRVR